ncbi:arrestin domain-containing protein, partial [Euroglyphus maynei]
SQILRSGRHEIPFRFRLPDDSESPPSFDGRYGCINYFVECLIDKEGEFGSTSSMNRSHRYGVEIKLENPVRKSLMLSVSGSSEKDLGLFCFGSGSVSIEAAIARKGHVAGETIKVKTLINNTSTLKVQPRAALYQTQIFMSGDRHRTLEIV